MAPFDKQAKLYQIRAKAPFVRSKGHFVNFWIWVIFLNLEGQGRRSGF